MMKSKEYQFSRYEWWNKVLSGAGVAFLAIFFIVIYAGPEENFLAKLLSLGGALICGAVLLYNDYRHQHFDKIKERVLGLSFVLVITVFYLFYS